MLIMRTVPKFKCNYCAGYGKTNPYNPPNIYSWSACFHCDGTGIKGVEPSIMLTQSEVEEIKEFSEFLKTRKEPTNEL